MSKKSVWARASQRPDETCIFGASFATSKKTRSIYTDIQKNKYKDADDNSYIKVDTGIYSLGCIELVRFFLLLSSNFIGMIEFVASALKWKSAFLLLLFALKKEIIKLCTRDYQINDDRADKYFFHLFKQNI